MLNDAGIVHSGAGENVAFVSAVDDEAIAASNTHGQLMADNDHAGNILSPIFTHVGIGGVAHGAGQGMDSASTAASWSPPTARRHRARRQRLRTVLRDTDGFLGLRALVATPGELHCGDEVTDLVAAGLDR